MLQTNARFQAIGSNNEDVMRNHDWSDAVYFGPAHQRARKATGCRPFREKGRNTIFRLCGPLDSWFDQTWRPGDIELIEYVISDPTKVGSLRM